MQKNKLINAFYMVCLSLTALIAGCGTDTPKVVPVSGKIQFNGTPCTGALVVFHPQDKSRLNGPKPVATVGPDGSYRLTTFASDDGAEPGDYAVTIVWNVATKAEKLSISGEGGSSGSDTLKGRYGNPSKPLLTAQVKPGSDNKFDFNLQ